jgi:hypothetical protein
MKLCEPIWKYDVKTLARDPSANLVYGLTTATAWHSATATNKPWSASTPSATASWATSVFT